MDQHLWIKQRIIKKQAKVKRMSEIFAFAKVNFQFHLVHYMAHMGP